MQLAVAEAAFVAVAIGPRVGPAPGLLAVAEVTFVAVAFGPSDDSATVKSAVSELAFLAIAVGKGKHAATIPVAADEITFREFSLEAVTVAPGPSPFTVRLTLPRLSVVFAAFYVSFRLYVVCTFLLFVCASFNSGP